MAAQMTSVKTRRAELRRETIENILSTPHSSEEDVATSLAEIRRIVAIEGLPVPNTSEFSPVRPAPIRPRDLQHRLVHYDRQRLRSQVWKVFLGVYHVSATEYTCLVKKGPSDVYDKVRNDTFRTLATDQGFSMEVQEDMLIRVLNAFAWKAKATSPPPTGHDPLEFTYVQGMNVLAAPFLYAMPEVEAFFAFSTLIQYCCPMYVQPCLQGAHCGLKSGSTFWHIILQFSSFACPVRPANSRAFLQLLDMCLQVVDPELFGYLRGKSLTAELYAFPCKLRCNFFHRH
ncbi:LOW QUALITY PROTEIN: rab-GTPase-TBC domain-containing protein [Jimgerdemannia flammicorona]|uniref:Rab-GTPase-TBC domain-containing protein n=1 Tax=Jimgerdemannia flammicorona TaxID=994334 RepID=A0A433R0A4_9FUNG|nr:LOW QUALITY PROTEIN: rab-GTPase-TBC domain-containing protein [Jimgerdemannia flammicorona]